MLKKNILLQQMRRFIANGAFVTLLDFAILNILVALGLWFLLANIISTSIAVATSYKINKQWVFRSDAQMHTFLLFVAVTLLGSYVLQGSILFMFHEYIGGIGIFAREVASSVGIELSADFWLLNIAKFVATIATAVWNFVLYRKVVFTKAAA